MARRRSDARDGQMPSAGDGFPERAGSAGRGGRGLKLPERLDPEIRRAEAADADPGRERGEVASVARARRRPAGPHGGTARTAGGLALVRERSHAATPP